MLGDKISKNHKEPQHTKFTEIFYLAEIYTSVCKHRSIYFTFILVFFFFLTYF